MIPIMAHEALTLHAAMTAVLVQMGGQSLDCEEIAKLIAQHDLYRRPEDGRPPQGFQVSLRARRYPQLFEGDESGQYRQIRLRLAESAPWRARASRAH
jgi:hypothetical protein